MRTTTRSALPPSAVRATAASVVGMLAVAIVSSTPDSPYYPILPDGVQAEGPLRWIADVLQLQRLDDARLLLVGRIAVVAAAAGFILILREAWHQRVSVRMIVLLAIAFHVIVLTLPLLFSRDVYSCAYVGRIGTSYGGNPSVLTPSDFPQNAMADVIWPGWRGTPSVYGAPVTA